MQPIGCRERGVKIWPIDLSLSLQTAAVENQETRARFLVLLFVESERIVWKWQPAES